MFAVRESDKAKVLLAGLVFGTALDGAAYFALIGQDVWETMMEAAFCIS